LLNQRSVPGICRYRFCPLLHTERTAESPWVRKASIVSVQTTDAELKRLFPEPAFFFGKLYLFEKHYFKREKFSV